MNNEITNMFNPTPVADEENFDKIRISIASP